MLLEPCTVENRHGCTQICDAELCWPANCTFAHVSLLLFMPARFGMSAVGHFGGRSDCKLCNRPDSIMLLA